ncbi:hypothetical protein PFISCL1PPCAC_10471, partial [Pristionchus fissidentatus]
DGNTFRIDMASTSRSGPPNVYLVRSNLRSDDASTPRRMEVVSKQATKVTALSTKLEWKVEQFEKLMKLFKNGQNLISRQFGCPQANSVTWELHVYPNGKREEDTGNVSFFLRQVGLQRGEEPIMTEFQIYASDASNQRVSVCRDTKDFTNQQGRGKFQVSRDKMTNALRNDGSLLLICEVEYFPPGSKISVEAADDDESNDGEDCDEKVEMNLRDSLREMLDSELFSDCTIKVGAKSMKAHRCILGQHSAVFRSMFTNEMLEAQEGIIDITDAQFAPVRAMIEYMYTGSFEAAESHAEDVLAIADKYAVLPLKEQCERHLAHTINSKSITSMVLFADTYSANILKQACIRYLTTHHHTVIRSGEWRQMKKDRNELATELLEAVLANGATAEDEQSNRTRSPSRKRARRNGSK